MEAATPLSNSLDTERREQFWASLALRHTHGLGARSWIRLLTVFGSAYAALQQIPRWGEAGVYADKATLVAAGSWRTTAKLEWDAALRSPVRLLLWHEPAYPACLRQLPDAPLFLYASGDGSLLSVPAVAIVGSRHCTPEGIRVCTDIAHHLAACGITIVSGMALGIDRCAHRAGMNQVGRSIAVLGTGMDVAYPKPNLDLLTEIEERGLVLTEFAPGTQPISANFPIRNRIISGLSLGVLVVEAALRSGSLITARLALEQNREVYAVPGSTGAPTSVGCQELIRQGARPVFSAEDILRDLLPQLQTFGISEERVAHQKIPAEAPPPVFENSTAAPPESASSSFLAASPLEGDAGHIAKLLRAHGACHADQICGLLELPIQNVTSQLIAMEVRGQVRRLPGGYYTLP